MHPPKYKNTNYKTILTNRNENKSRMKNTNTDTERLMITNQITIQYSQRSTDYNLRFE